MNDNIYTINEDGTLSRKGKVCLCVYDEGSCSMHCMAIEERGKGRVHLHCVGREIVAQPAVPVITHPVTPVTAPATVAEKTRKAK